ncbi:MAG: undecaprenyl-diphosphate phosphatase [Candidatus Marinimicrobia bacterium]|nr:undecaprenyl-diphosphate phosphatase [Candidatus Neomarinimicrobiota bacterium]
MDFSNQSLIFDVGLHLGSLLAILFYFRKELLNITNDKKLFNLLLIGSIPLILIGYIFYSTGIIDSFRNLKIIAWTTLIFGLLMYFADTFKIEKKIEKNLTIKNILIIN